MLCSGHRSKLETVKKQPMNKSSLPGDSDFLEAVFNEFEVVLQARAQDITDLQYAL